MTAFTAKFHRRRVLFLISLIAFTIIALGVHGITAQIYNQPRNYSRMIFAWRNWAETLSLEIPPEKRNGWQTVAENNTEALIAACTINTRGTVSHHQ